MYCPLSLETNIAHYLPSIYKTQQHEIVTEIQSMWIRGGPSTITNRGYTMMCLQKGRQDQAPAHTDQWIPQPTLIFSPFPFYSYVYRVGEVAFL